MEHTRSKQKYCGTCKAFLPVDPDLVHLRRVIGRAAKSPPRRSVVVGVDAADHTAVRPSSTDINEMQSYHPPHLPLPSKSNLVSTSGSKLSASPLLRTVSLTSLCVSRRPPLLPYPRLVSHRSTTNLISQSHSHSHHSDRPMSDSEAVSRTSVSEVRSILSSLNTPTELVLHIMDNADYCPVLCAERSDEVQIAAGHGENTNACWAAKLYLISQPLTRSPEDQFWRVKKVMWELEGHDQGWTTSHVRGMDYLSLAECDDDCSRCSNFKVTMRRPAPGSTHASSDLFKPMGEP